MNSSQLEVKVATWSDLIADLRRRGGGRRESGAFLLGSIDGAIRRVDTWVPYDELDPGALSKGYVRLETSAFTALWAKCTEMGKLVVADIHTHPTGPRQSLSDRTNPMIAQAGHIALIVPNFAQGPALPSTLSVNVYLGDKKWSNHFGRDAEARVHIY